MKLESLKMDKFKENALKKEQMFELNGLAERTSPGINLCHYSGGHWYLVDYAYDTVRADIPGGLAFHGYSNWRENGGC